MAFYADLHIHSKYSRACSRDCDLEHLAWWARRKGVTVVGTGDFTHPAWFEHLRENLEPAEPGLFRLRADLDRGVERTLPAACRGPVRFMLSVEISTIYKRDERTRKVHHLVYVPDLDAAERFNRRLGRVGNIASDGRPILGLDSRDLLEITLESGPGSYLVPAHAWTPWFAVLGSKSGFDAVGDCYVDLADHIFALETGLSSDPAMNWRVSSLDRYRLVSNSDAHSPPMLGREACLFSSEIDYFSMRRALETGEGYDGTVEFFPEEGKYHLDGHRKCDVCMEPTQTRRHQGRCPVCGRPLTIGVLHRVEELADRPEGARAEGAAGFRNLIQLPQVIGEILRVGPKSKAVAAELATLTDRLGPELGILTTTPLDEAGRVGSPLLAEALGRLREGRALREAGYDGEYGVIRLFEHDELERPATTALLFDPPPQTATPKPRRAWAPADGDDTAAAPPPPPPPAPTPTPESPPTGQGGSLPPPAALYPHARHAKEGGASRGERSSTLDDLDEDQRAAATVEGPLLIVAGPGTGKTRTLTHRIAHLVAERGVPPERCLAITFTRRAADELGQRLAGLLGERAGAVTVATFHGLGLAIVGEQRAALGLGAGMRVADEVERLGVLRAVGGASETQARRLVAEIGRRKRERAARDPGAAPGRAEVDDLLDHYDKALRERDLVDFDDLIALPVVLLGGDPALAAAYRERWGWISVDEYQDVDELQYRLLRLLTTPGGNLCAIGDPDQAIYGFRGADVGFFLQFRQDFPGAATAQLTRNYRSSAAIVDGAVQAIAPGTLVHGRVLRAGGRGAAPPRLRVHRAASEAAEAEFVVHTIERLLGGSTFFSFDSGRVDGDGGSDLSFADVAVLYRTDAQSPALIEALSRAGMPFQKRSHDRLADLPGVQGVLRALHASGGAGGAAADARAAPAGGTEPVLARVRRAAGAAGVAEAEVEALLPLAARCGDDLDRFLAELALGAQVDTWDPRADRVSLLTLHAAKGLEFQVVFLVGCEDGLLPLGFAGATPTAAEVAEERRLLFVGMTRARSHLYLSWAARRARHGTVADRAPSPFLAAIDEALLERLASSGGARRQVEAKGEQLSLL
jgi:DNA helicase II / ATP-dependent DNA helicase PcrA